VTAVVRRRRVLAAVVVALVLVACALTYVVARSVPDHRTTLLVDTSAPGTDFAAVADAVEATAHNTGRDDALSVRRFGGECGAADNTSEVADEASEVGGAVRALHPSGRATLLSGVLAAIDDFSGLYPFRGAQRNRIVVVSTAGVDACDEDRERASRTIREHVQAAGLELDIRVVGHRVPDDQHEALAQLVGAQAVTFTDNAAQLTEALDELVVPESPEAARISVTTSAPPPEPPAYAFATAEGFGVARGERIIGEAAGDFDSFTGTPRPAFTADGRFAFLTAPDGIVVLDVATGRARTVPCGGCPQVVPVDDARVAWLDMTLNLVVLDLAVPRPTPSSVPVTLPGHTADELAVGPYQSAPGTLAGRPDAVLASVAWEPSAYAGPETLYLIGLDGTVRELGTTDGNVGVGSGVFSPDGRTIAYRATSHGSACHETSALVLVDVATAEHRISLTADVLGGHTGIDGSFVRDIWYDAEGGLNAIFYSWRCSPAYDRERVHPMTRMRLEAAHWSASGGDPVLAAHPLGDDADLVLAEPAPQARGGTLYLETGGRRTPVADQVLAIAVAPGRP